MLTCETSHVSPWFVTRGSEHCAKVRGLDDKDAVALIVDRGNSAFSVIKLERGVNPLQELGKRFRISKDSVAQPPVPTTVEIYFS
jgi:hypothetical protein